MLKRIELYVQRPRGIASMSGREEARLEHREVGHGERCGEGRAASLHP